MRVITNVLTVTIVALVAGAHTTAQKPNANQAGIEDPDIIPSPVLKELSSSSAAIVVARVLPADTKRPSAPDPRYVQHRVHPLEIVKGSGISGPIAVLEPRVATANRVPVSWKEGQELLLFLKPASERGTYILTSPASVMLLQNGSFVIPEGLGTVSRSGRRTIPKNDLLARLRQR